MGRDTMDRTGMVGMERGKMSEAFVSLEVAKALKDAGYPQDQWPQMVYTDLPRGGKNYYEWEVEWWTREIDAGHYYAAPTPLQALEWLCDRRDGVLIRWEPDKRKPRPWYMENAEMQERRWFTHPNDLILEIVACLQEAQ